METTVTRNGKIEELLVDDVPWTAGYVPSLPVYQFYSTEGVPQLYALRDVELMITHPHISSCMEVYKSGIAGAEFETKSNDQNVAAFVDEQVKKFWGDGMPLVQGAYDYGWIAGENMYVENDGIMKWDRFVDFSPRDSYVLTLKEEYCGVRITNVKNKTIVDLPAETECVPSKALWYAHRPRYQQWYGASQYSAAWRPWRRLATKDSAETVIDSCVYRTGFMGPLMRYPAESYRRTPQQGGPIYQNARDMARQLIEQFKAGAGVALPSGKYPKEAGGGDKWDMQFPSLSPGVTPILEYIKYLKDEIAYGIGTPPEIMEAAETGSGYSGRAIPLEAFLMRQQRHADAILKAFVKQVLMPLVKWNFGPHATFEVSVVDLLKTRMMRGQKWMAAGQQQPGQPGQPGQEGQQPGQPGQQPGQPGMGAQPGQPGAGGPPPQAAAMGGGGGSLKTPYAGPRGGKGWRDAHGNVHYGEFSLSQADVAARVLELAKMPAAVRAQESRTGMKLLGLAVSDEMEQLQGYGRIRKAIADAAKRRRAG